MRIKQALVGITFAALAAPAIASGAQSTKSADAAGAKATRYCLEYQTSTGSRIREKKCLTKAEWAKRGVDVDEVLRK
jgi:hypothetical protein